MKPRHITDQLVQGLNTLRFSPPVTHLYNPLVYARAPHDKYIARFAATPKEVVFVGMNPGPFGMAQTGVPFGDVVMVRDWLEIQGPVSRPQNEHPKRPILGFDCPRREVSGTRVWGWAQESFKTPERFFERFFIANYCPLVFMEESGRNRTPDKLPRSEREALFAHCDLALRRLVEHLTPRHVVGFGEFAAERARHALSGLNIQVLRIAHPSPANPAANRGWADAVWPVLEAAGIRKG